MHTGDYYTRLGVGPQASTRQIKAAYRRLALEHHPDRNRDNPAEAEIMKQLNEAYAVLSNPVKRREYDALRQQFGSSGHSRYRDAHSQQDIFSGSDINAVFEEMARAFGFRGFEDIFRDFYGQEFQRFEFRRPRASVRGFVFRRSFPPGRERTPSAPAIGLLNRIARSAFQKLSGIELPEPGAHIKDRIYLDRPIAEAGGAYAYYLQERFKKLIVQIPPGVRDRQRIRLAGMGHTGKAGGSPGDLFLEVRLHRPFLKRLMQSLFKFFKPAA
jgi:DnaJ-class molecular chaperone